MALAAFGTDHFARTSQTKTLGGRLMGLQLGLASFCFARHSNLLLSDEIRSAAFTLNHDFPTYQAIMGFHNFFDRQQTAGHSVRTRGRQHLWGLLHLRLGLRLFLSRGLLTLFLLFGDAFCRSQHDEHCTAFHLWRLLNRTYI